MAISAITAVTNAANTLGNLILVTPQNTIGYQPQNPAGGSAKFITPSILFHYEGENTATLESDITDHWAEDNTALQDQIALKPVIITTQGFIGELNDLPPNKFFQIAQQAAQKLSTLSAYAPQLSITALLAYNEAVFVYSTGAKVVNNAIAAWNSITGTGGTSVVGPNGITIQPNQTKQQQYFQQFYGYWQSRTLFTIQTPWAIFQNMAIKSLKAIQSADTRVITDFEVSFKQIRMAQVLAQVQVLNFQGQLQQQGAPNINNGTNALSSDTTSVASAFANIGAA